MKKIIAICVGFLAVATLNGCTQCGGNSEPTQTEQAAPAEAAPEAPAQENNGGGDAAAPAGEQPQDAAPAEGDTAPETTE